MDIHSGLKEWLKLKSVFKIWINTVINLYNCLPIKDRDKNVLQNKIANMFIRKLKITIKIELKVTISLRLKRLVWNVVKIKKSFKLENKIFVQNIMT